MRPLVLLVNPSSGGGRGVRAAREARRLLAARGTEAEVVLTRDAADLESRARAEAEAGAAAVAVAGGDGTVQLAARALAGSATALGLLPSGRGNDLARALGIPRKLAGAVAVLAAGQPRALDLGTAGGRRFVTVASLGFDAEAAALVHRHAVPGSGTIAYLLAALRTLGSYRAPSLRLSGDFGSIEGRFFLVAAANTRSYGGGLRIAPAAVPDDGLLDLCLVRDLSRAAVLALLPRVFWGGHAGHPAVTMVRTRSLELEAGETAEVFADGEPLGTTPLRIELEPRALRVLAPPQKAGAILAP